MSKQNFKSQAKRKRELAKLDKRTAKDQKRAAKKAEGSDAVAVVGAVAPATPLAGATRGVPSAPPAPARLTLAQVVERWKTTKIVKPTKYR